MTSASSAFSFPKSRQFDLRWHLEERAFTLFRTYYFKLWTLNLRLCADQLSMSNVPRYITHRQIKMVNEHFATHDISLPNTSLPK